MLHYAGATAGIEGVQRLAALLRQGAHSRVRDSTDAMQRERLQIRAPFRQRAHPDVRQLYAPGQVRLSQLVARPQRSDRRICAHNQATLKPQMALAECCQSCCLPRMLFYGIQLSHMQGMHHLRYLKFPATELQVPSKKGKQYNAGQRPR